MSSGINVDQVFVNGRFLSMSGDVPTYVEAVAAYRGRVVATAPRREIMDSAPARIEVVDFQGSLVTPAFVDTHTHVATYGLRSTLEIDLGSPVVATPNELLRRIGSAAMARPNGAWIRGGGWTEASMGGLPTREVLDSVSPAHPVVLVHATGHLLAANTIALRLAGVDGKTPDPPGGRIGRDDRSGEPTGLLFEPAAMQLVTRVIPPVSVEDWMAAIGWAQARYLEEGVIACKESYFADEFPTIVAAYERLAERGELHLRPTLLRAVSSASEAEEALASRPATRRVRLAGVKVYLDGSLVARTAWLNQPYLGTIGACGNPAIDPSELTQIVRIASGFASDIAVHAIGDRAVSQTLDSFAQGANSPSTGHRSIVHALLASDNDIDRMAAAGVLVETQPMLLECLQQGYADAVDQQRLEQLIPLRRLLDAGVTVGLGSDAPTCPPSPRRGISMACTRMSSRDPTAVDFGTAERITPFEAIRGYTGHAARCLGLAGTVGVIEPGAFADFVSWDGDLLGVHADDIARIRPRMVVAEGRVVFDQLDGTEAP